MNELAQLDSDGYDSMIQVIAPPDRMWPVPWYLRTFSNTGYYTPRAKPEIIQNVSYLVTSPGVSESLPESVREKYMIEYFQLHSDLDYIGQLILQYFEIFCPF